MKQKFQFATKAVIINDDKILCLYVDSQDGNRYWDLPGGRIEFGEEPEEGLQREVFEEIDCEVDVVRLIDTWNHMPTSDWQIVGVFYYCRLLSNDIKLSDEHTGYKWIPFGELSVEFTAKTFWNRMKRWNWEEVLNDNSKIVYPIEMIQIENLVPNNLFLNGDKIDGLLNLSDEEFVDNIPPVLVTIIDGDYSLIDGHSRVYCAIKLRLTSIGATVQPLEAIGMEKLYRRIHEEAKKLKIMSVNDLEDRILYGSEHEEKWVRFCNEIMAEMDCI